MPVVEVGIVVGYLVAWAVQKARRAGHRLDETANLAIDVSADHLDELVRTKLQGHPALQDLDEEAAALVASAPDLPDAPLDQGAEVWAARITDLTRRQLELALQAALLKDADFSNELTESLSQLQSTSRPTTTNTTTIMQARASGTGRVYQAGRDQHINES